MTLYQLNKSACEIKEFIDSLCNRFNLPVYVDDDVCRLIAVAKSSDGGENIIWQDGSALKLESLALRVNMVSRKSPTILSEEKEKTHVEE